MGLDTLILYILTGMAMSYTPGPAVLLAMSHGSHHGLRGAAVGGAGIEFGNLIWFLFSAAGLTAVLIASTTLFSIIKAFGAAYLVYLGLRLLLSRRTPAIAATPVPHGKLFAQGFLTQIGNPKAVIFFGALLPQFFDPAQPHWQQFLMLGAITFPIDYSSLLFYGWLAHRGSKLSRGPKLLRWFDRVAGAFLITAGAKLAFVARA